MTTARILLIGCTVFLATGCCFFKGEDLTSGRRFAEFEDQLRNSVTSDEEVRAVRSWNEFRAPQRYNTYSVTFYDHREREVQADDVAVWLEQHPREALWVSLEYRVECGPSGGVTEHKLINRENWREFLPPATPND